MLNRFLGEGRHLSISTRIAIWFGISLTLLAVLVSTVVSVGYATLVHRQVDAHLREARAEWLPLTRQGGPAAISEAFDQRFRAHPDSLAASDIFLRLVSPEGRVLFQSPNFAGWPPLEVQLPRRAQSSYASQAWGPTYARSLYVPLTDRASSLRGWLELSALESSSHHGVQLYVMLLVSGFLLSAVVAALGGYAFGKRVLRPVRSLTRAAGEIGATDLARRLPVDARVRDELTDLAETFNTMLARLQASFERERRFTSHAAHELRTPLARMHSEIELALRRRGIARATREALTALLEDVRGMSAIVERLLTLDRLEAVGDAAREPVELSSVCEAVLARSRGPDAERDIELRSEIQPGVVVEGTRVQLREILENLLGNALKYTPAGGTVTVRLDREDHAVRLTVADTGIGFDEQEASLLFERFFRSDVPAVQAQPGNGLGLAVVRAIVAAHGGEVRATATARTRAAASRSACRPRPPRSLRRRPTDEQSAAGTSRPQWVAVRRFSRSPSGGEPPLPDDVGGIDVPPPLFGRRSIHDRPPQHVHAPEPLLPSPGRHRPHRDGHLDVARARRPSTRPGLPISTSTRAVSAHYLVRLLAALAQDTAPPGADQRLSEPLSERELEVLAFIAAGKSNKEIARALLVSLSTVKTHINNLYRKLEAHRRTQAVARAREMGLL